MFKGNSYSRLGFELTIRKKLWPSLSEALALLTCLTAFSALTLLVNLRLYCWNSNRCQVLALGIISVKRAADRSKNGVSE